MTMTTTARLSLLIALIASTLAVAATPAFAALSDEASAGQVIAARVDAGTATCNSLSPSDFEHLGEYVMERMVGSPSAHEAMNARMEAMMGGATADRMHEALGRRYVGCATTTTGSGVGMMGGGSMMGGPRGWGAMMGADYSWMRNGSWQNMNHADWQRVAGQMMGGGGITNTGGGWSTGAVVVVVLGGLVLGGLLVFVGLRVRRRDRPSGPAPA